MAPMRSDGPARGELILLAATEAWERFSYYGIRGLLVLFLTASASTGGMEWSRDTALQVLGWFAAFVYLLPVAGGWCGDRWMGSARAVRVGTVILILAYGLLAASAWLQQTLHASGAAWPRTLMFVSLALIALGTGLFKPNITALVGRLYAKDDPAREGGFLLFYLFMNIGVVLCGLVIGTLGEQVAWHFGFLAAALAMVLSAIVFARSRSAAGVSLEQVEVAQPSMTSAAAFSGSERAGIAVLAILGVFATLFWVGLEQTAGLMNLFAFEHTQRQVLGLTIPATWFQSLNPLFVLVLAPVFAALWKVLATHGSDPSTEWKFVLGLVAMASAFAMMSLAASSTNAGALANPSWLVAAYFLLTISELCIWTISLAAVTRLSPRRYEGLIIGLWYMAVAIGGWCAGQIGALTARMPMDEVFALLSRAFLVGALLLAAATPLTARLTRRAASVDDRRGIVGLMSDRGA